MNRSAKMPKKAHNTPPKISKFADTSEPALPSGESSIEIIKEPESGSVTDAAEDANKTLASMSEGMKIEVVHATAPVLKDDDADRLVDTTPVAAEVGPTEQVAAETKQETLQADEPEPIPSGEGDESEKAEDGIPDDPVITKAVDDIIAQEADLVLDAEDEVREAFMLGQALPKKRGILRRVFGRAWVRWSFFLLLVLGLVAAGVVPSSRYYILNTAGVRSGVELKVIDITTRQPLKNVSVSAGGVAAQTDAGGVAKLDGVRLGPTKLIVEKRAFERIEKDIIIGWGSNPLGDFQARGIGVQYSFTVNDYLSGQPVLGAEATSGEGSALADEKGVIVLTLDTASQEEEATVEVTIQAAGYRDETIELAVSNKEAQRVEMVPVRKHAFVSKRSGTYDIYTVDIDGRNEKKLVEGSGLERDDIALVPYTKEPFAALVSTRERVTTASGYLLSTLYLVDLSDGKLTKVDQSEKIQIAGWTAEGRLVYVKIASGAGGADPKRHRIMSFNVRDFSDTKELATANAFNSVMLASGRVYWAPSNAFTEDENPGAFSIGADGQDKQDLVTDREITRLLRSAYGLISMSDGQAWLNNTVGESGAAMASAPTDQTGRLYIDNPLGNASLWVDEQAGKGTLRSYDRTTQKDSELAAISGLKEPVYWLTSRVAVFRVKDSRETADYAVSLDGGEARKITNVSGSLGIDRLNAY
jgi:hypothetical protein